MSLISASSSEKNLRDAVEYTPVMLSAAAKAARATGRVAGRAAKNTAKIAAEAAGEIVKDAGLKTIKRPRGNFKLPNRSLGSVSGGSRARGKGPSMAQRDEAVRQRKKLLQRAREKEQNDALLRLNREMERQRRESAAKMREMLRM